MSNQPKTLITLAFCLMAAVPVAASAQSIPYGDDDGGSSSSSSRRGSGNGEGGQSYGVKISPYIEAAQIATAELSPGNDVLTYSRIAAGVDASIQGRNNGASVSLRYERYFGWGKNTADGDSISGIARGYTTIARGVRLEAGGLATRTSVENNGAAVLGQVGLGSASSQIYSVYAGPTVDTHAGAVKIDGGYRIGYTRVESPDAIVTAPGQNPIDLFDDSVVHSASLRLATKAGDVLPVGIGIGGGYNREDISNLDQRVEDKHVRGDVTLPVGQDLSLVAGVGYEDVSISSRDALRDVNGNPVIGTDGRYVTDSTGPRQIAYEASGIIWDAGVIWRPSSRTAFEAHVGKRYGTTSYYGSFAYAPSSRSSFNVSVYDSISGFGGQVNRALADLPTEFQANRNVLTGDVSGCVASVSGNNCLSNVLGSVRSSTFRARGVSASYNVDLGRLSAGVGAGFDRRKYIAAAGTVLATANGVIDENYWMSAYANMKVGERGNLATNAYANWFQSGGSFGGDATAVGASTSYGHNITNHLSATAAVGVNGVMRDDPALADLWSASALVGVRYTF